jgi:Mn-dependent DtxR family transcriptional regulator
LRVIASLASLVTYLRGMASDRVDPREIGADWTARLAAGLAHTMDVRERGVLSVSQVFDVHFRDFVGHEIETIRRLYEHFGLTLSAEAEARMRGFLAANPKDKHGAHRYVLADAGLDPATERRRYARYQERHAVALEPVD